MHFREAQDVAGFMAAESLHKSELEGIEPELRRAVVALHMDMRRLKPVGHLKEEAVAAFAKNGRHGEGAG